MRQVLANILVVLFGATGLLAAQPPNTPGTATSEVKVVRPEKGNGTKNSVKAKASEAHPSPQANCQRLSGRNSVLVWQAVQR